MNLRRPASLSVVLGVLITGLGLPAHAVDDRCLDPGLPRRVAFLSPYRTVQWAFTPQGFVDVR